MRHEQTSKNQQRRGKPSTARNAAFCCGSASTFATFGSSRWPSISTKNTEVPQRMCAGRDFQSGHRHAASASGSSRPCNEPVRFGADMISEVLSRPECRRRSDQNNETRGVVRFVFDVRNEIGNFEALSAAASPATAAAQLPAWPFPPPASCCRPRCAGRWAGCEFSHSWHWANDWAANRPVPCRARGLARHQFLMDAQQ